MGVLNTSSREHLDMNFDYFTCYTVAFTLLPWLIVLVYAKYYWPFHAPMCDCNAYVG
ncbi:hypothetical protein K458DRAFT_418634 [Lentithecium fluviatile CBS 122367]|uniref:Uncharacterized protein n=1 Tax=Lentithecium fluviatile CBS 122367 TaxID=1168545 RepID=A0A6G1J0I1_9PLEO|nr:hypothetical protein K458DRAFT_418634 [Lentithecium fluviatile CBS 122367]